MHFSEDINITIKEIFHKSFLTLNNSLENDLKLHFKLHQNAFGTSIPAIIE